MKAVRFHARGGPDVLRVEDVPEPMPGPGEALVAVKAVALNHLDVWVRRGIPVAMEMPHIGGADFAGVVRALGAGVREPAIGTRVVGFPLLGYGDDPGSGSDDPRRGPARILGEQRNGACCEAIALPAANLLPMPDGVSFEQAAAVPVTYLTAWTMLVERAALRPSEVLLVQGAGSGVGIAAIQIGRLLGARVLAVTSSPAKVPALRTQGADLVIDRSGGDLPARVRAATGGAGADVVFEHVGETTWSESVACAAYGGRVVTCGATTGRRGTTDLTLLFAKQLSLLGSTLGSRDSLRRVLALVEQGRLVPVIDRVLPLEACAEGHERIETGRVFGKIVLRVAAN